MYANDPRLRLESFIYSLAIIAILYITFKILEII